MENLWKRESVMPNEENRLREFTPEELSQFDGKEGRPAYVAVKNVVYDVTKFSAWAGGTHFDMRAGTDVTSFFDTCHNHTILERLEIVGMMVQAADPPSKMNLVWLELNGCSGNIISLLNGSEPSFQYMITEMVNLAYDQALIACEGERAMDVLFGMLDQKFILAVEGAVATKNNGNYQIIGKWRGTEITGLDALRMLGEKALHVIAVGACASHGGVSAGRPNPAQCVSVESVLNRKVINLPGCPCHPDWFLSTLEYLLNYGEPPLDEMGRPIFLYGITIHQRCERRSYFDQGIFATNLGEPTCMFHIGCKGPRTPIDCPIRKWNDRVSWPVQANTPCIGCAQFGFPDSMEPFITFNQAGRNDK